MHSKYFGFREEPFGVSPDDRFLFASAQHAEATASLYLAITQRRGFAVLVGAPGLGKTSILVNLVSRLAAVARVAFFVHPQLQGSGVLESVLVAMGLAPDRDPLGRHRQLHDFLLDLNREDKTCVVIFDEAQHLDVESLEVIRMLSNFETPRHKLIQFVFAGQPRLAQLLHSPSCEQILQRIGIFARLGPLGPEEAGAYIDHRLAVAGATRPVFSPDAVRAIAAASGGVPRIINTMCFDGLMLAYSRDAHQVDASHINEVVAAREELSRFASQAVMTPRTEVRVRRSPWSASLPRL